MKKFTFTLIAGLALVSMVATAEAGKKAAKASSYNRTVAVGLGVSAGPVTVGGGVGYVVSNSDAATKGKTPASASSGGGFVSGGNASSGWGSHASGFAGGVGGSSASVGN